MDPATGACLRRELAADKVPARSRAPFGRRTEAPREIPRIDPVLKELLRYDTDGDSAHGTASADAAPAVSRGLWRPPAAPLVPAAWPTCLHPMGISLRINRKVTDPTSHPRFDEKFRCPPRERRRLQEERTDQAFPERHLRHPPKPTAIRPFFIIDDTA